VTEPYILHRLRLPRARLPHPLAVDFPPCFSVPSVVKGVWFSDHARCRRCRAIFGDFVTHCRCTLSQGPTPHKAVVENKHQSAIRPTDDRTVEVPFRCFSASESCLFEPPNLTSHFAQLQWNQHALQYPNSHRLREIRQRVTTPKCKNPIMGQLQTDPLPSISV
jgi:hypothetical protein